ncbi:MAG: hypothetical protein ACOC0P_06360 [Planctomycetota bacterium]
MQCRFTFVAEPNDEYDQMLELAVWSIRHRAGRLAEAPISVIYIDREHASGASRLQRRYGVETSIAPPISDRYRHLNKWNFLLADALGSTDWVIHLDHDVVVVDALDELLPWMESSGDGFGGVPTGRHPHYRFDSIMQQHTDLGRAEIEATRHPWFRSGFPCFNSGVMFMRTDRRRELYDRIVPLSLELHEQMKTSIRRPLKWARIHWNRRIWDHPRLHHLIIGPWYGRVYSEQIALVLAVLGLRIPYRVWPHIWNWRAPDMQQGPESPIRILHYLRSRYPVDKEQFFDGPWIADYAASDHPGRQALAGVMQEYHATTGE